MRCVGGNPREPAKGVCVGGRGPSFRPGALCFVYWESCVMLRRMAGDRSTLGLMWLHRSRAWGQNHTHTTMSATSLTQPLCTPFTRTGRTQSRCQPLRRPATPSRHSPPLSSPCSNPRRGPSLRGARPPCPRPYRPPTPYCTFTTFTELGPRLSSVATPHAAEVTLAASSDPGGPTGH